MTFQQGGNLSSTFGLRPENVEVPHQDTRDPTSQDYLYPIGKVWINQTNGNVWILVNLTSSDAIISAVWEIYAGGSLATEYVENTGTAVPSGGVLNVLGSGGITTTGSGNTITITPSGTITVQIDCDVGDAIPSGGVINVNASTGSANAGSSIVFSGSGNTIDLNTSDSSSNTCLGKNAGNSSLTGANNSFFGYGSGKSITSGESNAGFGLLSLQSITSGSINVAIGLDAGSNYTSSESSNILISNLGTTGESHTTRIGTQGSGNGQQNTCYIAGIIGNTVSNAELVTINSSTGQLGVTSVSTSFIARVYRQVFTTSGTYTPTTGMLYCDIEVVGGGGGSGGIASTNSTQGSASAGGGGGGYARGIFSSSTIGSSQSITIGAGGTAGAAGNNSGGNGGTTSVGSLISATGGQGSSGGPAVTAGNYYSGTGGDGGSGSGGDFQTTGTPGGWAMNIGFQLNIAGSGGSSFFGGGGNGGDLSPPDPGTSYGGGASGPGQGISNSAQAGAAGAPGVVIITEYVG